MKINTLFAPVKIILFYVSIILFTACDNELKVDDLPNYMVVGTVSDVDGNVYRTIKFGTQTWMIDNLKTTRYNDSTEIPVVKDSVIWKSLITGACCDYDNSASNSNKYGKLYNWYAINDARKIAPKGWHVASNTEWAALESYLDANGGNYDGTSVGYKVAKALASTSGWSKSVGDGVIGNNMNENNSSGFSALPGGVRYPSGAFLYKGNYGIWWSKDGLGEDRADMFALGSNVDNLIKNNSNKAYGYSVRCVKHIVTIISTLPVTGVSKTTALSGGNITDDDGLKVTARGVCWSLSANPTIENFKTIDSAGMGIYTSKLTGLKLNTTYYVRAYATNIHETAYGNEYSFKTNAVSSMPTLSTLSVANVTENSAVSGGSILSDDGALITEKGVCWNTTGNPDITNSKTHGGYGLGLYSSGMSGLLASTTYYVKAYATNSSGTGYGNEIMFTTTATTSIPIINTINPSSITETTAISGGNVISDGALPVTARGVCWSLNPNPMATTSYRTLDGTGVGQFSSAISGLTQNKTYYVRAYATNSKGTAYGNEIVLQTNKYVLIYGTVTDVDGNSYKTIKVGNQTWMAENLRATRYRDNSPIANISNSTTWDGLTTGAYCDYNNDASNGTKYGKLYNWYAVADKRNIAPIGWHVATNSDWNTLVSFFGSNRSVGGLMREIGTANWYGPNTGATNESGFSALPGGMRYSNGTFQGLYASANWWCSTNNNVTFPKSAVYITVSYNSNDMMESVYQNELESKLLGCSVRCVKD